MLSVKDLQDLAAVLDAEIVAGETAMKGFAKLQAQRKAVRVLIERLDPEAVTTN